MKWSKLDKIKVNPDLVWSKTFALLYCKAHMKFGAAFWASWLGCYHEYGTYSATFYTYLEIPM